MESACPLGSRVTPPLRLEVAVEVELASAQPPDRPFISPLLSLC
jgi:hypothetical protein